jgi:hypothetical protein
MPRALLSDAAGPGRTTQTTGRGVLCSCQCTHPHAPCGGSINAARGVFDGALRSPRLQSSSRTACAVGALALLLGGCGGAQRSTPSQANVPSRPDAPSPASTSSGSCVQSARSICLTAADDGRTVSVGVGWRITLDLHAPQRRFGEPMRSGANVLGQLTPARRNAGALEASYRALTAGRAELLAVEQPICHPGRACPQYLVLWKVEVRVLSRLPSQAG